MSSFRKSIALACAASILGIGAAIAQTDAPATPATPPAAAAPATPDATAAPADTMAKKPMKKHKHKHKHKAKKMSKTKPM